MDTEVRFVPIEAIAVTHVMICNCGTWSACACISKQHHLEMRMKPYQII